MGGGGEGVDYVPKVLSHFLPKYWKFWPLKSYLSVVQNGPIQKLPQNVQNERGDGGSKATFGQCPKARRFFFGCLP